MCDAVFQSLRILHINTGRAWRGGEQQVVSLMKALRKRGCENFLAAQPRSVILERVEEEGFETFAIPMRNEVDLLSAYSLAHWICVKRPDVIHAHTSRAHTIAFLAKAFFRAAPPLIVSRRVAFPVNRGWMNRWKYAVAAHYIAISEASARTLWDAGISQDRVSIVPSGVDEERFQNASPQVIRDEFGIGEECITIGNVAFCEPLKSQRMILDAAPEILRAFPNVHFFIIGAGSLEDELRKQAENPPLAGRVHVTGFRKDVGSFLSLFDIFVMPSQMEGLCSSILDAQYFGIPIIATNVGGIPEIVHHEENGLLIPPNDPDALAKAIQRLLTSPDQRRAFGQAGKEMVLRSFTIEAVGGEVLGVYEGVCGEGRE